jgi:hypothetical protein
MVKWFLVYMIDAMTYSQYPSPESVYECQEWSVKAGEWVF